MKKRVVFFVVLTMMLIGSCVAQSASNDAQRIVGTWTTDNGTVFVFNANGTGTISGNGQTVNFVYGISTSGEMNITKVTGKSLEGLNARERMEFSQAIERTHKLFFSPDGRRMILDIFDNDVFQKK